MAVAYVQRAESLNLGYVNLSPTTGNLVCLTSTTSAGGGSPSITSVSFFSAINGGGSNLGALTVPSSMATANDTSYWVTGAYGKVPSGTASIGVAYNGGLPGEAHLEAVELSGADGTSPFIIGSMNQQLHPGATTDAITSGTGAVGSAAYLLGVCNNTNTDADTVAGTGFTIRGATTGAFCVEDATKGSSGSYAATFTAPTHGSGDYYHTFLFAIAAAGAGGSTVQPPAGSETIAGSAPQVVRGTVIQVPQAFSRPITMPRRRIILPPWRKAA